MAEKKDRKNINWEGPTDVVKVFDETVTDRRGQKGKWVGSTAAMLMYLDASDEKREEYEVLSLSTRGAKTLPNAIKTKLARAIKGKPKK